MNPEEQLCPMCGKPMVPSAVKSAPNEPPTPVDPAAAGEEPPVIVREYSCPACHHVEGTMNRGRA